MYKEIDNWEKNFPGLYDQVCEVVRMATLKTLQTLVHPTSTYKIVSNERFFSSTEAAHFLKITLNTLYSKVQNGEIPHYRSGKRKLLFCPEELGKYVSARKVKSLEEITEEVQSFTKAKKHKYGNKM